MDCEAGAGHLSPVSPHHDPDRDSPGHVLDYITFALILVCTIQLVIGNVVMVWFRNYPPIKSKSVVLTMVSSCGGLIWIAATLVFYDHFVSQRIHTILGICSVWMIWLQVTFGFVLWISSIILRLVNVRLILIMKRGAIKHVMVPLLVLLTPSIVFSSVMATFRGNRFSATNNFDQSIVLQPQRTNHYPHEECKIVPGWEIGLVAVLLFYFAVFIGLAISLRNVRAPYNEFRLIRNGGIFIVFLTLVNSVSYHTKIYHEITGRCFLSLTQSGAVFYYFWAHNSEVVYNVLFNKEPYLLYFLNQINSVPLTGHQCDPNPLESLFFEIRDEVASAEAEVLELEHAIAELQEEHKIQWSLGDVSARHGGTSAGQHPQSIFTNLGFCSLRLTGSGRHTQTITPDPSETVLHVHQQEE